MPRKDLYPVNDPYPVTLSPRFLRPLTEAPPPPGPATGGGPDGPRESGVGLTAAPVQTVRRPPSPSGTAYADAVALARRHGVGPGGPTLGGRSPAPCYPHSVVPAAEAPGLTPPGVHGSGVPPKPLDLHGIEADRRRGDRRARLAALLSAVPALAGAVAGPTSAFGNALLGIGSGMAAGAQSLYAQNREAYQQRTADAYTWLQNDATRRREDADERRQESLRQAEALLGAGGYREAVPLLIAGGMTRQAAEALVAGRMMRDKTAAMPTAADRDAERQRAEAEGHAFVRAGDIRGAAGRYAHAYRMTYEEALALANRAAQEVWEEAPAAYRGRRPEAVDAPAKPLVKGSAPGAEGRVAPAPAAPAPAAPALPAEAALRPLFPTPAGRDPYVAAYRRRLGPGDYGAA